MLLAIQLISTLVLLYCMGMILKNMTNYANPNRFNYNRHMFASVASLIALIVSFFVNA